MLEAGAQARMALHQSVRGCLKSFYIERSLEIEDHLNGVDVQRLRIIKRMEQQPLLQRREREDVFNMWVLSL